MDMELQFALESFQRWFNGERLTSNESTLCGVVRSRHPREAWPVAVQRSAGADTQNLRHQPLLHLRGRQPEESERADDAL